MWTYIHELRMSNTTAFYYPMVAELLKIHLQYILNFILYCLKSAK